MTVAAEAYTLRADWVFPVDRAPIRGGYVDVSGERIAAVGSQPHTADVVDLGSAAILPGLVNAHVHLEFSDLSTPLGEPGMPLTQWIPLVLKYRRRPESPPWPERLAEGVRQSLAAGVTTLGEIATTAWPPAQLPSTDVDLVSFIELIGRGRDREEAALEVAKKHIAPAKAPGRWRAGLSPHAPYTISRRLLESAAHLANEHDLPLMIHLAESPEEIEWLANGTGPLAALLAAQVGPEAAASEFSSLDDLLHSLPSGRRSVLAHCNYLDEQATETIAASDGRMSIVYCPRTHAFFRHAAYPLAKLLQRGINVALGTDGRGSNPDLSLLNELRYVARRYPQIGGDRIVRMGTLAGAEALGREALVGSLTPGKWANLAVVHLGEEKTDKPYAALLDSDQPVVATLFRGRVVYSQDDRLPIQSVP